MGVAPAGVVGARGMVRSAGPSASLLAFLLALLLALGTAGCGGDERAGDAAPSRSTWPPTSTSASVVTTTTTTTSTSSTATTTTSTTVSTTTTTLQGGGGLRLGAQGPEVAQLQAQLSSLGYWVGEVDGVFGPGTLHAVTALQKAAGLARDGVVDGAISAALDAGLRPAAESVAGHVVELDLDRQLLLVVDDGQVTAVFDTSTGRVAGTTPRGHWQIVRQIDGFRRSALGLLYRPKYFHEGVAIHGYTSVPSQPASHGCVRVTYAAMDHIWATGLMPIGTPVWVR